MDALVAGDLPLRVNGDRSIASKGVPPSPNYHALGDAIRQWHRPGFEVSAACATWDFTILKVESRAAETPRAYASIPRVSFERFCSQLDAGGLDAILAAYLASPRSGRRLDSRDKALSVALWDELGPMEGLLAPEYDPATGRLTAPEEVSGSQSGVRRAKPRPLKPRPLKPLIAPGRGARSSSV